MKLSNKTSALIKKALGAIAEEDPVMYNAETLSSSEVTKNFFKLRLSAEEKECFDVAFLNNHN